MYRGGMPMASQHPGSTDSQEVNPIALRRVQAQRSEPDSFHLRNPDPLIVGNCGRRDDFCLSRCRKRELVGCTAFVVRITFSLLAAILVADPKIVSSDEIAAANRQNGACDESSGGRTQKKGGPDHVFGFSPSLERRPAKDLGDTARIVLQPLGERSGYPTGSERVDTYMVGRPGDGKTLRKLCDGSFTCAVGGRQSRAEETQH